MRTIPVNDSDLKHESPAELAMDRGSEAKVINEGVADLEAGKTVDGKAVLDEMRRKYGF
ncbi:MAG: hypothetical protein ILO68_02595 [Clostridia bacterium]|nr:hypothetical protein [Clostridia bacterium]